MNGFKGEHFKNFKNIIEIAHINTIVAQDIFTSGNALIYMLIC